MKRYRAALGVSQEKLAVLADLSAQTINDIEGCRMWVSDKCMAKLARALQVEVYQLLLPVAREGAGGGGATGGKGVIIEEKLTKTEALLALQERVRRSVDREFEGFIGGVKN
jgi:DNA-binding XRE family transcriptional regulator